MKLLELITLGVLRDCDGVPQTAAKLFVPVNRESATRVTSSDLQAALNVMERSGHVFAGTTHDGIQYTITVAGRARLAEANL